MQDIKPPYVSIVIPAFNSASTLGQTIEACLAQDYPEDKIEIVIVDDGSTDDTRQVAEAGSSLFSKPVRYIYQKKSGPAAARNRGWRQAKGDVIFFTDADCIPAKSCLATMVKDLDSKNADAVAGTYGIRNEKNIVARCIHAEIMFRHSAMPDYINSFGTYNVLIKRSVLEELFGFNEGYLTSSAEDSELAYRIIKKGYRIYFERNSAVSHFHEERLYRYLKKQFTRSFWAIKLWKHHPDFVLKDYYLHWKDLLELPFALMIILAVPFFWIGLFRNMLLVLMIMYILIQAWMPLNIYFKDRHKKIFFYLWLIMFIRGFVRISGGAVGLIFPNYFRRAYSKNYYARYKNFNHSRLSSFIIEGLKLRPEAKANVIIDAGCGIGKLIDNLRRYSDITIGVDISPDAIRMAREDNSSFFVLGDNLKLPIKDSVSDICTCIHVIEHINEPVLLLKEMRRIMKHDGKVVFITPNRKWTRFSPPFLRDRTHVKEFTTGELKSLISDYFYIKDIKPFSMFTSFGIFNPVLNKLVKPDIYISAVKK